MKEDLPINEEIEAILKSLDGMQQAEVPPFFYTRLQARWQRQAQPTWLQQVFSTTKKLVFAFSTLLLFVILNITTINMLLRDKKLVTEHNAQNSKIESFASDYNLSSASIYNDFKPIQ